MFCLLGMYLVMVIFDEVVVVCVLMSLGLFEVSGELDDVGIDGFFFLRKINVRLEKILIIIFLDGGIISFFKNKIRYSFR